ncbi:MAG: HlyD family efflux transporter periplasmic adaptor subunit [Planctomycetes bacterium]|nr:HlyD family efflux transporter periplasmic adaptor subunit [Planctomycetota bacterium]
MTTTTAPPRSDARTSADRSAPALRAIEDLAVSDVAEDRFFKQFLELLLEASGGEAGVVWMLDQNGLVAVLSEVGLDRLGFAHDPLAYQRNLDGLLEVLRKGEAAVHAPGDGGRMTLPTRHALVLVPVPYRRRTVGALELFLPATVSPQERLGLLALAEEACALAGRYLDWREDSGSTAGHLEFWSRFERFVSRLHQSLHPMEVAQVAVNDGRELLGCDRVSLLVRRGSKTRVVAVSGQERIHGRANLVRALRTLAAAAIESRQSLTYAGRMDTVPPPLEAAVTEYLRESGSRLVKVIPLFPPEAEPSAAHERPAKSSRRAFAALAVERLDDSWLTPVLDSRSDLIAEHASRSLWNARSHHAVFLLPLWRMLGACVGALRGRTLMTVAAVLMVLAGIGGSLALIPATYRVEASGTLMPANKREVFAPWEGEVVELFVTSGQQVTKGQELARLRNEELDAAIISTRSRLNEKLEEQSTLKAELNRLGGADAASRHNEEIRLRGGLARTVIEIGGLRERLAALEDQQRSMTLRAPIDGTIATFQLEQLLLHRPVERGEMLLEIMDEAGPWQLEVQVPEGRMGHVFAAQESAGTRELPAEFVLGTSPEYTYRGRLAEIATRSDVSAEAGTVVDVRIAIDRDSVPDRRIGSEVRAKIDCGQRSLFYVLFGDVVEFAQRRWW